MPLTDISVRQAKPKEKPYKLTDGGGLYLHVQPNGGRYWRLKYRVNGREKLLALGTYPDISLADARERRGEARKVIAKGGDPSAVKKEQKDQAKAEAENSFESIAREWHEKQKGRWVADHAERVLDSLEKEIFPELATSPFYATYRMGYHKQATVHGFRATASTILNESGFMLDAIEWQLTHAERNKVRAAYHRAEYLEERWRRMQ